jgi:eukaryotic-like serine/threonine-protein kinase
MADSPTLKESNNTGEVAGWMAGEYRLGRKLGEGGFGAVYEAVHPLLKRRAAVKVLHRLSGSDSDAVLRFVAEARAVNQIKNRHIIDIFSFGRLPDGRHFYVMDLLEGEPLDRYLAREGRCTVADTVQLLRPIAEALDAAHAAGVVHRDLKPQNIYLSWDTNGETVPKLLDFGMAKLLGDSPVHTRSGTPLGTPLYMSPEQARGDPVDGRSDVYALGVLCHELLTGQLPITGESTIAVLMAHIIQTPPRVSEVCSEVSPELDEPVLRMLEKKPELRPATATEALNELLLAATRAGSEVPPGPPRLSRPAPGSEVVREHSRETADTTLQPYSPSGTRSSRPDFGRDALVRSAGSTQKRALGWPWWILLVVIAALATLRLTQGFHGSPSAAASAPLPPVATPVPLPQPAAAAVSPNPSVQAEPVARDPVQPPPAKRVPGVASARRRIPADLESPF